MRSTENLFEFPTKKFMQIIEHEGRVCGVIVHEDLLIKSFDQTLSTCDRLLNDDILKIYSIPGKEHVRYIATSTSWRLDGTDISLHDHDGRCLAVDVAIDDRGIDFWEYESLAENSYSLVVREDRDKTYKNHMAAVEGIERTFHCRVRLRGDIITKRLHMEHYDTCSSRLLRVHHHV